jgi:hypothetical protein
MVGAFLAGLRAHQVIGVDPHRIRVVTRTSARMSIYRPEDGGVLAWSLCEGGSIASNPFPSHLSP